MDAVLEPPVDTDARRVALERRLLELGQAELDIIKSDGLQFYRPYPKQEEFHLAQYKRRAFFAGNRAGKSTSGVAEDVAWLRRERSWYPHGDPRRTLGIPQRPIKMLVLTVDWDKVEEIFTSLRGAAPGKFWRFLPQNLVKHTTRNHSGAIDMIELTNGSLVRFDTVRSWLANPNSVESSDWDVIHVDEPIPEQMWKGASRGLIDRGGWAWFTLTALTEPWIWDYFTSPKSEAAKAGRFYITAWMDDNPYLSQEDIDEYIEGLSDEEIQCRRYGLPLDKAGMVYKEFAFERHVLREIPHGWKDFNNPRKKDERYPGYSVYIYIDPHPQTPHAVQFFAVPPTNDCLFLYDEIFEQCPISELCRLIHARLDGRPIVWARIDKSAFINNPVSDRNMAEEFHQCGIYVEPAVKDLSNGILQVKEALKRDKYLYVSPNCIETLYEFSHYVWGFVQGRPTNKPVDKHDHMMENLYRCILDKPEYVDLEKSAAALNIPYEV